MAQEIVAPVPANDEYYNLGPFNFTITTTSVDAQIWFNRGLVWVYSFNHAEGAYCFQQTAAHDPACAMAYWGIAYAVGPNYNKAWHKFDHDDLHTSVKLGYKASRTAKELAARANAFEQGLIVAIQSRFPTDRPATDYHAVNKAYASAMKPVYDAFGHDLNIATLYADSLMNMAPWALWDLFTGKPNPKAPTIEVKAVLEQALAQEQDGAYLNPGLLHLYIHFIEMSPTPELGINVADHLRELVPEAGHVNHMPTHLDILIGDWRRSIASNSKATLVDEKYFKRSGAKNFYTFYRMHNYHSLIYAAMFAGKSKTALNAVTRMESTIPEEVLRIKSPPMADWLEQFMSVGIHVMVRFGMWKELKAKELPHDRVLYSSTTAITHYARGIALAALGDVDAAMKEQDNFHEAWSRVPQSRRAYNGKMVDVLKVAAAMLEGEIQYRCASYNIAFAAFRRAINLEDELPYSEPWSWMQPVRHAYAALLMEQGHLEEAAKTYRADLGLDNSIIRPRRHPNNVWSLKGYHECLTRLGRMEEAAVIEQSVKLALAVADVPIRSSCFCRLDNSEVPQVLGTCYMKKGCH
ncbi:Tetratricopeptide-like helical [Penicillium longicatenatum]|uniref:Tetratricopeptide-like helical n=1 Tax=Penicillium longicatenatum TaxID=1561947 RepID=UPI00254975CD|nr:Tetratricopeptide-like helical [Penicillium longicatenatum]KAJ5635038.1 Tetratricopeptide-like helical [Penicillium longicatenatum]